MALDAKHAVIAGAGLGGLSAAIHLRLRGWKVTMFEACDTAGGRANVIARDGFRFDTGPSLLNYPWVFENLFSAAGKRLSDYVKLLAVDPSVRFEWPDGTSFSLSTNIQKLRSECERLEPGCGPRLFSFLRDAAAKFDTAFGKLVTANEDHALKWLGALRFRELLGTGVWRSLDHELSRFFRNRYIREALGSYGMYLGGSPYNLPGLFTILPYGELAYGLWLPEGGIYSLVCAIERLARELGVSIHTGCRVERIECRGNQVRGVRLAGGESIGSQVVVSNLDVASTNEQLLGRPAASRTRMTPGVLTFYWGLDRPFDRFGHHTIFLPNGYRRAFDQLNGGTIPDELPFYVSIPSATDPRLAPEGGATMFVLVPTPLLSQLGAIDWDITIARVKAQVISRLGLDATCIRLEEVWTPLEWNTRFGLYDGSAFGAAHTLPQMGPFRDRNYSRDLNGLYYVGASTTPGTGMPMVVLGGGMVAERIESHAH